MSEEPGIDWDNEFKEMTDAHPDMVRSARWLLELHGAPREVRERLDNPTETTAHAVEIGNELLDFVDSLEDPSAPPEVDRFTGSESILVDQQLRDSVKESMRTTIQSSVDTEAFESVGDMAFDMADTRGPNEEFDIDDWLTAPRLRARQEGSEDGVEFELEAKPAYSNYDALYIEVSDDGEELRYKSTEFHDGRRSVEIRYTLRLGDSKDDNSRIVVVLEYTTSSNGTIERINRAAISQLGADSGFDVPASRKIFVANPADEDRKDAQALALAKWTDDRAARLMKKVKVSPENSEFTAKETLPDGKYVKHSPVYKMNVIEQRRLRHEWLSKHNK